MADIFLSYSQKDFEQAAHLARCLEGEGWTVFWDRDIPPGKVWSDVLDAEYDFIRGPRDENDTALLNVAKLNLADRLETRDVEHR